MEPFEINMQGGTYLGGAGFPFKPGESIHVRFSDAGISVLGQKRSARFYYVELQEIAITGPGAVTTGGGFIGGGFGVEGALEGMGIAAILNGLTSRTKIHTFVTLITNFGELHMHYTAMEPGVLRVVLAPVFHCIRVSTAGWMKERLEALEMLKKVQVPDGIYAEIASRLSGPPVWPDPEAEEAVRQLEAAERKRVEDERAPKGICPNCSSEISVYSETCPRCKAFFGEGSAWKVQPLSK